jgi:aspartate-semialdehyde dehydrogenase
MSLNLAIAGVTGAVGQEFLRILEERDFPFDSLKVLASSRSARKKIEFKGKQYIVEKLTKKSFERIDITLHRYCIVQRRRSPKQGIWPRRNTGRHRRG